MQRELSWNALSQRYVLRMPDSGQQRTFATLEEALAAAGRWMAGRSRSTQQLDPEETYEVGVRARLRRGRLPSALRDADVLDPLLESQRVVLMGTAPLRRWGGYIFIAVAAAVVLASLILLARSAENSAQFADWQLWILGINAALVLVMAVLLARRVYRAGARLPPASARFAAHGAHRGDVQRAGDRAAAGHLRVRAAIR